MFIGPAMRLLLVALRQPAEGTRADLERRAMDICAKLLADLNIFFSSTLDLYSVQFTPCIWGKFLGYGIRLQEAAAEGVHKLHHVHNVLKCSDRRRDKERILKMEGVVLSEMLRQCDNRGLGHKLLEYSPLASKE